MRRPASNTCSLMLSGHSTMRRVKISPKVTVKSELRILNSKINDVIIYMYH